MRFFTINEVDDQRFYQVPKSLFNNSRYQGGPDTERKSLALEAKMAYGILRDRMKLSQKNNWVNEKGEVYLNYKREDLARLLECTPKTVKKIMDELIEHELIFEVRLGLNRPNQIYICHIEFDEKIPQIQENQGSVNFTHPDAKSLPIKKGKIFASHINNTNTSNTDSSDTDSKETTTNPNPVKESVVVPLDQKENEQPEATDDQKQAAFFGMLSVGIDEFTAMSILKRSKPGSIKKQLEIMNSQITRGIVIENPSGWLCSALKKGGYKDPLTEKKEAASALAKIKAADKEAAAAQIEQSNQIIDQSRSARSLIYSLSASEVDAFINQFLSDPAIHDFYKVSLRNQKDMRLSIALQNYILDNIRVDDA